MVVVVVVVLMLVIGGWVVGLKLDVDGAKSKSSLSARRTRIS